MDFEYIAKQGINSVFFFFFTESRSLEVCLLDSDLEVLSYELSDLTQTSTLIVLQNSL